MILRWRQIDFRAGAKAIFEFLLNAVKRLGMRHSDVRVSIASCNDFTLAPSQNHSTYLLVSFNSPHWFVTTWFATSVLSHLVGTAWLVPVPHRLEGQILERNCKKRQCKKTPSMPSWCWEQSFQVHLRQQRTSDGIELDSFFDIDLGPWQYLKPHISLWGRQSDFRVSIASCNDFC